MGHVEVPREHGKTNHSRHGNPLLVPFVRLVSFVGILGSGTSSLVLRKSKIAN
jgi:hypothetical protein